MNLNIENRPILFLNVESREITMLSKIIVQDETTKQILKDKLISKTYSVDELVIKMDGTIDSDFEEFYEAERLAFIKEYNDKLTSKKPSFNKNKFMLSVVDKSKKGSKKEIDKDKLDIHYRMYKDNINKILTEDNQYIFEVVSRACYYNASVYKIVKQLLTKEFDNGEMKAQIILSKIEELMEQ